LFVSTVNSASYLGTDLCFTHIIKNTVPGSTADARPNFNVFFLKTINDRSIFIEDVHYQYNIFTGGYIHALKFKTDFGIRQENTHLLTTEYVGVAPTWLSIDGDFTKNYGSYYNSYIEHNEIHKYGMAVDFSLGFRQIFGQNRFFSFGWTAELSYLMPFFNITPIFVDESFGLSCVKGGFSFSFRLPKK
jgi:hypothetical protein